MKCVGKKSLKCECCKEWRYDAPFYEWYSVVVMKNMLIAVVCHKCAVRELFGSNYKRNKRYERWLEEVKKLW